MEGNNHNISFRKALRPLQSCFRFHRYDRIALHHGLSTTELWICPQNIVSIHSNYVKNPDTPFLHRLQGITILDADYWVLRLIWGKRLFRNAANYGTLMTVQQAHPGFKSISAALNKVLAYNLMHLTKRSGGNFDNDAEGCYGKIIPSHTMLCSRRMGHAYKYIELYNLQTENGTWVII